MVKGFPSRRDSIILAAIDIISERGMQGLSTKEIAIKQGISESLLYKHFKSIDEVLVAVVEYFSRFDSMIINTVLKRKASCKEKILQFAKSFIELYESYPALSAIILNYETLMNYDHTREIIKAINIKRSEFIKTVIEEGQNEGELDKIFSPDELTDIIKGTVETMLLRWKMSEYNFELKKSMLLTIEKIIDKCLILRSI